mmetsp:Transcript_24522/g.56052  ORF Transcript_24522/g.56052 Transcript_24522/m.56052 type:complete len:94 (-) Transcript_24522:659-940(-)
MMGYNKKKIGRTKRTNFPLYYLPKELTSTFIPNKEMYRNLRQKISKFNLLSTLPDDNENDIISHGRIISIMRKYLISSKTSNTKLEMDKKCLA